MTLQTTTDDSVQFSLAELRRLEIERQAGEREARKQKQLEAERARVTAEQAELERIESEKRRCLRAEQKRTEREAQHKARLEAEQRIAIEAGRAAVEAKRVELEIKRIELEAEHLRSIRKSSPWKLIAMLVMLVMLVGQGVFMWNSHDEQRVSTVTPAEIFTPRAQAEPLPYVPAETDLGDVEVAPVEKVVPKTTGHTGHTGHTGYTGQTGHTGQTVEKFDLEGCDPNQPLC